MVKMVTCPKCGTEFKSPKKYKTNNLGDLMKKGYRCRNCEKNHECFPTSESFNYMINRETVCRSHSKNLV